MFNSAETATINKVKTEVQMPTVSDITDAMNDPTHAELVRGLVVASLAGFYRNLVKAGQPLVTSFEGVLEARALAASRKGGDGSSLAQSRAMKDSMKAYLVELGVPSANINKVVGLFASVNTLEIAAESVRAKIQSVTANWSETLTDEEAVQYAAHIERVADCGSDATDDLLGDF